MTAPTMRVELEGDLMVIVHTAESPSADDWRSFCEVVNREQDNIRGSLVFNRGVGPTSKQREELRRALRFRPAPPTAILTASQLVRGIITSLNWFFGRDQAVAFALSDFDGAYRHVKRGGVTTSRDATLRSLQGCARTLGVELPAFEAPAVRDSA